MNNTLSAGLSRILSYSQEEARNLKADTIGPECLLLGLIRSTTGKVPEIFGQFNVSVEKLRDTATRLFNDNRTAYPTTFFKSEDIRLDAEGRRILKLTLLEARLTGAPEADSEHLLLALLRDVSLRVRKILNEEGITYERVAATLNIRPGVRSGFGFADDDADALPPNGNNGQPDGGQSQASTKTSSAQPASDTPITDSFGTDLTQIAAAGGLDPVVGREREIQRIAQILSRRKKNNPILIGEPGVGKSAVVEGLAGLIATRRVSHSLIGKRIVALDMASIVAGTQYRGQFEERLRRLILELKSHKEIILFIDEIHTIIGAGSAPGSLDAANILKPALARGEVQCIGATTISEYKKSIEKDGALERRFQKVQIEPTTSEETLQILRNVKDKYEAHHSVYYTDEAIESCVRLTGRYVSDRAFPDKALDALDEAGSRKRLTGVTVPEDIRNKEKEIEELKQKKTEAAQNQDYEQAACLRDKVKLLSQELEQMNKEWLDSLKQSKSTVTAEDIAEVISMMCGVPVHKLAQTEAERLRGMKEALGKHVIAQDKAIEKIVRAITRSRLGLKGNDRPIGTFMFVGPTGVGKTYLVKCLAEWMFGSKDALIRIDMSEYGEKYSTSRLVGAPPGYVGYEEGGQLTERVRRHPYSIILLDEIEKAHSDVFNTLLQVMDEGRMTDGNGTTVDFRNTIIVMTSNSGTRQLKEYGSGVGFNTNQAEGVDKRIAEGIVMKTLKKQFAPEFLNRLDDIIMFDPLNKESAGRIADLEIQALKNRLRELGITIELTGEARDFIIDKGFDAQYGARSMKRAIQLHIEDKLCDLLMEQPELKGNLIFSLQDNKVTIQPANASEQNQD